jgi:hypothetical protein
MDHTINVRMLLENLVQGAINSNIDIVKWGLRPTQELNAIEDLFGGVV